MKQRLLVADGVKLGTFSRTARGYKKIIVDESLDRELVKFVDDEVDGERVLRLVKDVEAIDENFDEEEYIIVTKEFGLVGYDKGVSAEIEYIFCDDGVMFITLKKGALNVILEDKILVPNVNYDSKVSFTTDEIFWVNADWLKSFHKSIGSDGDYALFLNEFKFHAVVAGQVTGKMGNSSGLSSSSFKPVVDAFEDLSLGAFDVYMAKKKTKEEAKSAKEIVKMVQASTASNYEFDDEDEEEDYSSEDDYDDEDGFDI